MREGRSATEPVVYEHGGMRWVVRSTGTFAATVRGRPLEREVWADISSDPGQNVYFEMDAVPRDGSDQSEAAGTGELLGIWTTHILLLVGEPLKTTDIRSIYPGQTSSV